MFCGLQLSETIVFDTLANIQSRRPYSHRNLLNMPIMIHLRGIEWQHSEIISLNSLVHAVGLGKFPRREKLCAFWCWSIFPLAGLLFSFYWLRGICRGGFRTLMMASMIE